MGYLIAAYLVVLVTLAVYGFSLQSQRRALIRDEEAQRGGPAGAEPEGS